MTVDRRLLNWGVFLVLVGGIPLAVSQGWIDRDIVARAWELWPFILIGAGVGLILAATPLRALGGVIVAATLGTMLGSLLAVGFGGFSLGSFGCGPAEADAPQVAAERGAFDGGTGRVVLDANCAEIRVTTAAGNGWSATVNGTENARPTIEQNAGDVIVRSPSNPVVFPFGSQRATWGVELGTDLRLDLDLGLNAGSADVDLAGATVGRLEVDANAIGSSRLDLSGAAVERLDVSVNAADINILLPAGADLEGSVSGNAASIGLCAAAGVGLRLVVDDNITASDNFDEAGLVLRGGAWESPDYATAATQVQLRTTGGAVSYTLNPEDGCR
jgi:hypothetical protein